ncbi:IS3 family transposase [Streptomyces sp. NBC_01619]|uniref:IS3 family transposase n=1 Tax=Streptomyces sp. NBC_01619 TaxID=2975901 RepID=UPI00338EADE1
MCERLDVSKSGYYDWRRRPASAADRRREELKLLVQKAFGESDSTYGYRRVHAQVARWGHAAGLELVRQLMRELGLQPCQPRPKRFNLTQAVAGTVPDPIRGQLEEAQWRSACSVPGGRRNAWQRFGYPWHCSAGVGFRSSLKARAFSKHPVTRELSLIRDRVFPASPLRRFVWSQRRRRQGLWGPVSRCGGRW